MSGNDWTERELLVNLCVTAEEQRRLLEHLNSAERTGAVSSMQIEGNPTKDLKVRISTKHYVGSPLTREEIDSNLEAHAYAHRRANEMAMNGWAETLTLLDGGQDVDPQSVSIALGKDAGA